MKLLVVLVIFSLCFHSLALDFSFIKGITSDMKRDTLYTSDCTEASAKMNNDNEYSKLQRERECEDPKAESSDGQKYTIACPTTKAWTDSCKKAGGDVCVIKVGVYGKLSPNDPKEATYTLTAESCVPKPCKKGDNIAQFKSYFVNVVCPLSGGKNCKMDFTCASRTGFYVGLVFLSIGAIFLAGLLIAGGGYLIYKRYFSHYWLTANNSSGNAPFAEYSELAQYEQEDESFISDTSGADDQEEEHSIN